MLLLRKSSLAPPTSHDARPPSKYSRRLMFAHAVRAGPQVVEQVLAIGVGNVVAMNCLSPSSRSICTPRANSADRSASRRSRDRCFDAPGPIATRAAVRRSCTRCPSRRQLIMIWLIMSPPARNVGHAAQVAGRVFAIQPAARLHLHHGVFAGGQIVELVEAVRCRSSPAGPCRCRRASSSFTTTPRDALLPVSRSKMPSSLRS